MRLLPRWIAIIPLGWAFLTGCEPKAVPPINVLTSAPDEADLLGKFFLPAGQILSGFDPPDSSGQWRIGDSLLLGFQIDNDTPFAAIGRNGH